MSNYFHKNIQELYDIIVQPIDIIYKLTAINNYKSVLNIGKDESFGEYYHKQIVDKKLKGAVYTPIEIAKYIVENTIFKEDIIKNPFIKISDPSCGCGNLIIPCFEHLYKLYKENLDQINTKHGLSISLEQVHVHIVDNNIFGFDIDKFALKILTIDLFNSSNYINFSNFKHSDFLIDSDEDKYDIFIGNPPYIGQKTIEKDYSLKIKKLYKELYKDKGDLSYCFFGAALNKLKKGGKLSFITSRYFLEAPSGEVLRKTLKQFCAIDKIVDFYGIRPFKNIGIDPVMIFLTLGGNREKVQVIKPLVQKEKQFLNSLLNKQGSSYSEFNISKNLLNDLGWVLRNTTERSIIDKIEKKCFTTLGNICHSFQGIISGCDKAFVVDNETVQNEGLEIDLIKPWIKSSFIKKEKVSRGNCYLIYSNLINAEESYPKAINHIKHHKDKLQERRECKNGVRKWYELQWGREQGIFEDEKIVFPYKASSSRFALDKGSYFSADVYSLLLKDAVPFTYEYILKLLNSSVYEYYFKTFAKKLGEDMYEYYPNNLMKLCIPTMMDIEGDADSFLYSFFELNDSEINIIEQYTN
jgi:adenine-specific DNA-methyltransferase